jgi:hypothetical protein
MNNKLKNVLEFLTKQQRYKKKKKEAKLFKKNTNKYMYRAVRCVRAPKGSVVNFTAYQNFIELI